MQETITCWATRLAKLRIQRHRAYALFTALAILVSISTTYLLVRPATTMTAKIVCGMEEHTHTEACYDKVLVCEGRETDRLPDTNVQENFSDVADVSDEKSDLGEDHLPDKGTAPSNDSLPGEELPPGEEELPGEEIPPSEEQVPEEELPPGEESLPGEVILPDKGEPSETEEVSNETAVTEEEIPEEDFPDEFSMQTEVSREDVIIEENSEEQELPDSSAAEENGVLNDTMIQYESLQEVEDDGETEDITSDAIDTTDVHEESEAIDPATVVEEGGEESEDAEIEVVDSASAVKDDSANTDEKAPEDAGETEEIPAETTDSAVNTDEESAAAADFEDTEEITESDGADEEEEHVHTENCYALKRICGREEHTHEEACYQEKLPQGTMLMVLPEGMAVPDNYSKEYSYIDPGNSFGVKVYAPPEALPENAVLVAELLEEDSEAYASAAQALEEAAAESAESGLSEEAFTYDGFVALDICFLQDGAKIEPTQPVYVCIHVSGLLPENADPDSVEIQHHAEVEQALPENSSAEQSVCVEVVAENEAGNGVLEEIENPETDTVDIAAAFSVEKFSTFTATYTLKRSICEKWDGWKDNDFYTFEVDAINHYEDGVDTILFYADGNVKSSGYFPGDMDWSGWLGIRVENRGGRYQVIQRVAHGRYAAGSSAQQNNNIGDMAIQNSDGFLLLIKNNTDILPYDAEAYDTARFMVNADGTDDNGDWIVVNGENKYKPAADWPEGSGTDYTTDGSGDNAALSLDEVYSDGDAWKSAQGMVPEGAVRVALYPKEWPDYLAGAPDVVESVEGNGAIDFQLFNYSKYINKTADSDTNDSWRDISRYFLFRGEEGENKKHVRTDLPATNRDNEHDEDGFTKRHATVERRLDENGYPVLDLTRNADGSARTDAGGTALTQDALLTKSQRSMAYLFREGDHAVSAYRPVNTILQYDDASGTYRYDSRENAVDYDTEENRFFVRNYVERNDDTASSDRSREPYYDFLPFNQTGGLELVTRTSGGYGYQLDSSDVDYWFGMRMDVDFYQVKDGQYLDSDMVFRFSGDDDVWVFIDGVLVLDLGGTHGMVSGSINFATGEVEQYLDWNGTTAIPGDDRYFATTIQDCFDAAGATPNNGWKNYDADNGGGIFADYTPHTLSFFYLERGSSVANCMIDFNLPTVPEKSLTVTKEVKDPGDVVADDTLYTFRVLKENGEAFVEQGAVYTLMENDTVQGTRTVTAEDGSFQLMSGQSARFEEMLQLHPGVTTYFVEELLSNEEKQRYSTVAYQTGGVTGSYTADEDGVIGESTTSYPTPVLSAESTQMISYTNTVKPGDLVIRKVIYRTDGMDTETQTFTFEITGPVGTYLTNREDPIVLEKDTAARVSITTEEPLVIYGLPAGSSIAVAEIDYEGYAVRWKHDCATENPEDDVEVLGDAISVVPIGTGTTTTLVCTNTTGTILPSTGGSGTILYESIGSVIILLGFGLLFVQRHRKRGESEE